MGSGPFRDTSAAIERAETLERENAELLAEIERLRDGASETEKARAHDDTVRRLTRERDALKIELDKLRYSAPATLENATRHLREERDALRAELQKVVADDRTIEVLRSKLEAAQDALVQADHDIARLELQRDELSGQIALLKERMPPSDDNRGAVFQRVTEERDELLAKVRDLEAEVEGLRTRRKR